MIEKCRKRILHRSLLFLILLGIGCIVIGLNLYRSTEKDVYVVARSGTLTDRITVKGLFLYEETVITAEEAGTFYSDLRDGDGVAVGDVCGKFHRLNDIFDVPVITVSSPISGIYSERIDGWEAILVPERLTSLDLPMVMECYEKSESKVSSFVRKGALCFKVIDNKKNILFLADLGTVTLSEEYVSLLFNEELREGVVLKLWHFADRTFALISMAPLEQCYTSRSAEMELILGKKDGILVDAAAVTTCLGEIGVYRMKDGDLRFCPVTVLCKDENQCLVSGISSGDRLLCVKTDCVF